MFEVILSRSVDEFVPFNRWIASLSNGETIFEDRRKMKPTWERLKEYIEANNLSITQLRAKVGRGELKLPKGNQEGYIQKKKAWSTGATGGICICIGYVQGGRAVIHELGSDMSSRSIYCEDPGEPWTIYRRDIREKKSL